MLINKGTLQLIKEYTDDRHCLELLQFFGKYPSAHFNRLAIIHAMNNGDNYLGIAKALKRLVDNKLVEGVSEKGTIIYSLTGDMTIRDIISNIATLDLPQRKALFNDKNIFTPQKHGGDSLRNAYNTVSFPRPIFYRMQGPLLSLATK
jgi:hypothetical protein